MKVIIDAPSEYNTYRLVKDANNMANDIGLEIEWHSDQWRISTPVRMVVDSTVTELLNYLCGFQDGIATEKQSKSKK